MAEKWIVLSDSHGDRAAVSGIVERHLADCSGFLFLGDGMEEFRAVMAEHPELRHMEVPGNNDRRSVSPLLLTELGGHRILLTHGDRLSVKRSLMNLAYSAMERGAEAALFGHTHAPAKEDLSGLLLLNPGALRYPWNGRSTYGILTFSESGIEFQIKNADE